MTFVSSDCVCFAFPMPVPTPKSAIDEDPAHDKKMMTHASITEI